MKHLLIVNALVLLLTLSIAQTVNNKVFSEVEPLIASENISTPFDAAPDGNGENAYFIATGAKGAGVFQVSMQGGNATEIKAGEPFVQPTGLALSSDSKWVFVADSEAQGGIIFQLSLEDNNLIPLAGTEGTAPRGLEVVGDQLYFTGKEDGQPAVFRISVTGGEPVTLAKGVPFTNLSSVAATEEGVVYVSDRGLEPDQGVIYRIDNSVTPIAQNLILGNPAGIALTADASVLAVSSLSTDGHAQVVLINTATLETILFNRVIGANVSAGGLHRSHGGSAEVFAWIDNEGEQVYKVKPKKP